jgi:uncharacterized protein YpmB
MKKILITSLFAIILITNQLNAEEIKQTKQVKETKKKELSKEDEKLIAEFMKSEKELKDSKELGKTLDEINNKLGTNKK